jgi:hypothetical protein
MQEASARPGLLCSRRRTVKRARYLKALAGPALWALHSLHVCLATGACGGRVRRAAHHALVRRARGAAVLARFSGVAVGRPRDGAVRRRRAPRRQAGLSGLGGVAMRALSSRGLEAVARQQRLRVLRRQQRIPRRGCMADLLSVRVWTRVLRNDAQLRCVAQHSPRYKSERTHYMHMTRARNSQRGAHRSAIALVFHPSAPAARRSSCAKARHATSRATLRLLRRRRPASACGAAARPPRRASASRAPHACSARTAPAPDGALQAALVL